MNDSPLRYDVWIEEALRNVIRRALAHVADEGLPGDHHFYVTFLTTEPGVVLSDPLRAAHPEEMSIVLQHRFWDLEVGEDVFSVTLTFSGKPERLRIPFDAVTAFADPSVNFGLQLKMVQSGDFDEEPQWESEPDQELEPPEDGAAPVPRDGDVAQESKDGPGKETRKSGEVITLDAFRKK